MRTIAMFAVAVFAVAAVAQDDAQSKKAPAVKKAGDSVKVRAVEITEGRHADLREKKPDNGMFFVSGGCQPGLVLGLELIGGPAGKATNYGMLKLTKAADDRGTKLELEESHAFHDPIEGFADVDRDMMYFGEDEKPTDRMLVDLNLSLPARDATSIDIAGTLQLKIVEPREITIDDFKQHKGPIEDKLLKAAGLTCEISDVQESTVTVRATGNVDKFLDVKVIGSDGKEMDGGGGTMQMGDTVDRDVMLMDPIPDGAKLRLIIAGSEEILEVEYKLEKLPLPK